ncbi:MAG: acyl-CoA dehydrogenase family protein [Burkholderiales bacterium]|nr:acyl-CoA dehydrogenase family protein [Burkholderiales bacterium]
MFDTPELAAFRAQVRAFVRAELPDDVRATVRAGRQLAREQYERWHARLAARGYLVPHWPVEAGGQGWGAAQRLVFDEEMCTNDAPELNSITFDMIGPVLIRYGDAAQKAAFLPAIAAGTQWWCQGYSEPNAGSDLASLKTRAERRGDRYVVNGSKIWTSGAQYADWMFCLVRTDAEAKAQEGISFLLIDMKTPGITVRPIRGIHGWEVFNEVFLDDVAVPAANLVGQENRGWTVAKSLLEFERLKLARVGENKRRMARAREIGMRATADGATLFDQSWFRKRFAALEVRLLALEANAARFVERAAHGEPVGAEVSMLKLRGSQLIQLWEQLAVDALGAAALAFDPAALHGDGGADALGLPELAATASSRRFLSRGYTIAGGSSEIQHNIIAKQVLGL